MTNSKGERAREARHINQSLLTLSTIIQRLSEEHHRQRTLQAQQQGTDAQSASTPHTMAHLPYRDSKLTRLLESALDGNGHIAIICTISPTLKCSEETANTLKFGARAKLIGVSAKVNESVDDKTLLRVYRQEIESLKEKLRELEAKQQTQSQQPPAQPQQSSALHQPLSQTQPETTTSKAVQRGSATAEVLSEDDEEEVEEGSVQGSLSSMNTTTEQQRAMLQMISEMERLILKADTHSIINKPQSQSAAKVNVAAAGVQKKTVSSTAGGSTHGPARGSMLMKPGFTNTSQKSVLGSSSGSLKAGNMTNNSFKGPAVGSNSNSRQSTGGGGKARLSAGLNKKSASAEKDKCSGKATTSSPSTSLNSTLESAAYATALTSTSVIPEEVRQTGEQEDDEGDEDHIVLMGFASYDDDHSDGEEGDEDVDESAITVPMAHNLSLYDEDLEKIKEEIEANYDALQIEQEEQVVEKGDEQMEMSSVRTAHSGGSGSATKKHKASPARTLSASSSTATVGSAHNSSSNQLFMSQVDQSTLLTAVATNNILSPKNEHVADMIQFYSQFMLMQQAQTQAQAQQTQTHSQELKQHGSNLVSPTKARLVRRSSYSGHVVANAVTSTTDTSTITGTGIRSADEEAVQQPPAVERAQSREAAVEEGEEEVVVVTEQDNVLLGVSKMLHMLKGFIANNNNNATTGGHHGHSHGHGSHTNSKVERSVSSTKVSELSGSHQSGSSERTSTGSTVASVAAAAVLLETSPRGGQQHHLPQHSVAAFSFDDAAVVAQHQQPPPAPTTGSVGAGETAASPSQLQPSLLSAHKQRASSLPPLITTHHSMSSLYGPTSSTAAYHNGMMVGGELTANGPPSSHGSMMSHTYQDYQNLLLDFHLKQADNHFLQEELEKKDAMLQMLTEGLKEVEESQRQWLYANQELSNELAKERMNNTLLWNEINRLNEFVMQMQQAQTVTQTETMTETQSSFHQEQSVQQNQEQEVEEVMALSAGSVLLDGSKEHDQMKQGVETEATIEQEKQLMKPVEVEVESY